MINKKILTLIIAASMLIATQTLKAAKCENEILVNTDYDTLPSSLTESWFVCPYVKMLNEQTALYKSMEHVNWISINKIGGDGESPDPIAAKGTYCLKDVDPTKCNNEEGFTLENPGIVQKIDLWRQRLKTFQESKNLRPYYDSQRKPQKTLDNRSDESRMALLDLLSDTRTKLEECVTGYNVAHTDNSARIKLFTCQEGATINNANSYRITPDFPYPAHAYDLNCYPFNAEYYTRSEKEQCARNKDRIGGCQATLLKPSYGLASGGIFTTYLDDVYCSSGRQSTAN